MALNLASLRRQIREGREGGVRGCGGWRNTQKLTEFARGRQMQRPLRLLEPYLLLSMQSLLIHFPLMDSDLEDAMLKLKGLNCMTPWEIQGLLFLSIAEEACHGHPFNFLMEIFLLFIQIVKVIYACKNLK